VSRIEPRLEELGLELPAPLELPGNFELVKVYEGIGFIAGHGPFDGSKPLVQGAVGRELSLEEGYNAAKLVALSILASLKQELGDLDRVQQWLRAVAYVQTAPGFHDNAKVANGFSDTIIEIWGDEGRHARSAPGQGPSPVNVPVIVDAIVAVS
jgi:YjgF/chorismate_mutase-like, putative endoribonuclease